MHPLKSVCCLRAPLDRLSGALLVVIPVIIISGCATKPVGLPTQLPGHEEREKIAYLYYLDGAGGGTAENNWAEGVRDGLFVGGYPGAGEMYSWETGKGLMADQDASVEYKRSKAKGLAAEIQQRVSKIPDAPIYILSFSAGAAESVFALEELPETVKVDRVVMLGSSISQDYDLTEALKRVKDKMYLYTSTKDEMLGFLMKFSGTADRRFHDPGAGINGFVLPEGASHETRELYSSKIVAIPWTKSFKKHGDEGHHFDNVKKEFVRDYVAPLVTPAPSASPAVAPAPVPAPAPSFAPVPEPEPEPEPEPTPTPTSVPAPAPAPVSPPPPPSVPAPASAAATTSTPTPTPTPTSLPVPLPPAPAPTIPPAE